VLAVRTTLLLALAQVVAPPTKPVQPPPSLPTTVRWSVAISASPAAPPIIEGDHVYIVLQSGVVSARNITDGAPAWEVKLPSERPVAVDGGRVFVATPDQLVALNAADGTQAWSVPSAPVTAPLLAQGGWLIAATDKTLTAFRSADGSQVWSRSLADVEVMPTVEADNLYVPLQDGRLLALELRTGADRWVKSLVGPLSEVLAFPDKIFFGTGDKWFFSLRASDGERDWQRVRLGSVVRGRPVADEYRIYVASMDNTLRAYRRTNGALLWHPSVPFRPTTGPTLIESVVVVAGNAAELHAFAVSDGRPAGQITLAEPLLMPPAFGRSGEATLMSVFTGNLTGQWKLVLSGPAVHPPGPPHE
jgi:outer membrane protein assembly factor BamB